MEINLTTTYVGILSLIIFVLAYAVVMAEEFSHLRKSKPVIISAALIWAIIAFYFAGNKEYSYEIEHALEHNILKFSELFLFLLVAMTYINALEERNVFDVVRYQCHKVLQQPLQLSHLKIGQIMDHMHGEDMFGF